MEVSPCDSIQWIQWILGALRPCNHDVSSERLEGQNLIQFKPELQLQEDDLRIKVILKTAPEQILSMTLSQTHAAASCHSGWQLELQAEVPNFCINFCSHFVTSNFFTLTQPEA